MFGGLLGLVTWWVACNLLMCMFISLCVLHSVCLLCLWIVYMVEVISEWILVLEYRQVCVPICFAKCWRYSYNIRWWYLLMYRPQCMSTRLLGLCSPFFTSTGIAHTCDRLGFDSISPAMLSSSCVSHLARNRDWKDMREGQTHCLHDPYTRRFSSLDDHPFTAIVSWFYNY